MKSLKPSFYVMIAVVFAALLYVIHLYKTTEGFNADLMALYQKMTPDQKTAACKTLNEQITSYAEEIKTATPEQKTIMYTEIADMKKNAAAYGC